MRKIPMVALGVLAAACSSQTQQQRPIAYAAPQAPTSSELFAIQTAQTTLQGSVTFAAPTQPGTGGPGLADQLAASLGAYTGPAKMADASGAKLAQSAVQQAFATGGMNPACVTTAQAGGVTTVTWGAAAPCTVDLADPTMTMHVAVSGTLTWNQATGVTGWNIHETYAMTASSGGQPVSAAGTADLYGTLTVGASTIAVDSASVMNMQTTSMGMTFGEQVETTLKGTVGYQASPFCITSGSLRLEHRMTVAGMPQAQGWDFGWTGCGAFTVAHGS